MNKTFLILVFQLIAVAVVFPQSQTRKLPSIINHPSLSLYAPFISADGNALLFISNSGQDGAYTISYTSRESDWSAPVELPKHLNNRLNFMRGYALSADGKKIYVSSAKSPVIGGYDIFTSDLKGSTWSNPENMMLPINSKLNEACPSLTPDGKTMYFMRCEKMDLMKAESCKIFRVVRKSNGQWDEPVELPASINAGNSQTPRIMADGETLIFSSDKLTPSKGGMDLYLSRYRNGSWTSPVPLDFVNTEKDDQYVSVSALGRYLLKEAPGPKQNLELTEFLMPANLRPKGLMKVEGNVTDENGASVSSYVSVTDLLSKKRVYSAQPSADGSFVVYLAEGTQYEISVDPDQADYGYFAKLYDLRSDRIAQREKLSVVLKKPKKGEEIPLDMITFKPFSPKLELMGEEELKRFARFVKANASLMFDVHVVLEGYREDSVQSSPDFTEIRVDTLIIETPVDTLHMDTTQSALEEAFHNQRLKTTFHNDRTPRMIKAMDDFLKAQGVPLGQVSFTAQVIPAALGETRMRIKAFVR
jgi:hypothetical protein